MPLETLEQPNIKDITIKTPEKRKPWFNAEREVSPEVLEACYKHLGSLAPGAISIRTMENFFWIASKLKLISPERFEKSSIPSKAMELFRGQGGNTTITAADVKIMGGVGFLGPPHNLEGLKRIWQEQIDDTADGKELLKQARNFSIVFPGELKLSERTWARMERTVKANREATHETSFIPSLADLRIISEERFK